MIKVRSLFLFLLCWNLVLWNIALAMPLELEPTEEEESLGNPDEMGPYLEGDILVPVSRNGVVSESRLWPNGIIYYAIAKNFTKDHVAVIEEAIEEYHRRVTCIRFVRRTNQKNFVHIRNVGSGCSSYVGYQGNGKQDLMLKIPGCVRFGIVLHELMHALGFYHEHSRMDRDDFIQIVEANVQTGKMHNFDKKNSNALGVLYDYGSVLHYSSTAFSKNGQPTIIAMQMPTNVTMGQRKGFSESDVQKLNCMYKCWNNCTSS